MTENISFENALKELENITIELEKGDISLDKSIELFERGIKLSKICSEKLNNAKQNIICAQSVVGRLLCFLRFCF